MHALTNAYMSLALAQAATMGAPRDIDALAEEVKRRLALMEATETEDFAWRVLFEMIGEFAHELGIEARIEQEGCRVITVRRDDRAKTRAGIPIEPGTRVRHKAGRSEGKIVDMQPDRAGGWIQCQWDTLPGRSWNNLDDLEILPPLSEIAMVGMRVRGPMGGTGTVRELDMKRERSFHVQWDANPTWPLWYHGHELEVIRSDPGPRGAAAIDPVILVDEEAST